MGGVWYDCQYITQCVDGRRRGGNSPHKPGNTKKKGVEERKKRQIYTGGQRKRVAALRQKKTEERRIQEKESRRPEFKTGADCPTGAKEEKKQIVSREHSRGETAKTRTKGKKLHKREKNRGCGR